MELKLPGHKGIVRSIAFTLDDTRLISGSTGKILLIDFSGLNNLSKSQFIKFLDCSLKVWDVQEGAEIRALQGHTSAVYCLQVFIVIYFLNNIKVSGDGNFCVSVGMDKCLKLWDLRMHECSASISINNYAEMNYVSLRENTKNYPSMRNIEKRGTTRMVRI